ncbi:unnamed protein product [Chrysoparadoxa australica]
MKPKGLAKLIEWVGDESPKEGGVNTLAFRQYKGTQLMLAAGGEDGVVRLWHVIITNDQLELACSDTSAVVEEASGDGVRDAELTEAEKKALKKAQKTKPTTPQLASLESQGLVRVNLMAEFKGHTKAVSCIKFHPSLPVVISSSKDGTCRVWDCTVSNRDAPEDQMQLALLPTSSGMPSSAAVGSAQVMCRACGITAKGDDIYTVQSAGRGKAYVTRWSLQITTEPGAKAMKVEVKPLKAVAVSDYPLTSLSIRADDERLAVGDVEGMVHVLVLPGLERAVQAQAHDLPVTALSFAPPEVVQAVADYSKEHGGEEAFLVGHDLLTCSADYKVTLMCSQGNKALRMAKALIRMMFGLILLLWQVCLVALRLCIKLLPIAGICWLLLLVYYYYGPTVLPPDALH